MWSGCPVGGGYGKSGRKEHPCKRGRKPEVPDDVLLLRIREVIEGSGFCGEGYKKIHRRLAMIGIKAAKSRVLKVMRENELLSPYRHKRAVKRKNEHTGTIITQSPDKMWATDGKKFLTVKDGWCWLFPVIDHFNDEIIAYNMAKTGTRFAAMEPVRAAVQRRFGLLKRDVCKGMGLLLRSDHGSQYDSHDFKAEMDFLGLEMSHSFVRSPECNGCIERFNRTVEEEVFSVNTFMTLADAETAMAKFIDNYNRNWLIHRLDLQSPIEYRFKYENMHPSDNVSYEKNKKVS